MSLYGLIDMTIMRSTSLRVSGHHGIFEFYHYFVAPYIHLGSEPLFLFCFYLQFSLDLLRLGQSDPSSKGSSGLTALRKRSVLTLWNDVEEVCASQSHSGSLV